MLETVAILGPSGFVGSRLIEHWHLTQKANVVPIVRSFSNIAAFARFSLDWRLADTTNVASLAQALRGCHSLVHLATGDARTIGALVEPVYQACEQAKVKRLVFLSSASVFGQNPLNGTNDWTPLPKHHPFAYNAAKAKAEQQFLKLRSQGTTEVVILRPGIVYGPNASWVMRLIQALRTETAYWYNQGQGIFNGIYVDNLIHAIEQTLLQPGDGQAFLVGDTEATSWHDFYAPIVQCLGLDLEAIHNLPSPSSLDEPQTLTSIYHALRSTDAVQRCAPYIPAILKRTLGALIHALPKPPTQPAWPVPSMPGPTPTREMQHLYHCHWKFPHAKASDLLGYAPPYTFDQAMQHTTQWVQSHFGGNIS